MDVDHGVQLAVATRTVATSTTECRYFRTRHGGIALRFSFPAEFFTAHPDRTPLVPPGNRGREQKWPRTLHRAGFRETAGAGPDRASNLRPRRLSANGPSPATGIDTRTHGIVVESGRTGSLASRSGCDDGSSKRDHSGTPHKTTRPRPLYAGDYVKGISQASTLFRRLSESQPGPIGSSQQSVRPIGIPVYASGSPPQGRGSHRAKMRNRKAREQFLANR